MADNNKFEFLTPVGRFVQGGFEPQTKDSKGNPLVVKTGPNKGQPTQRYFMAVAFDKNDPAFLALYGQLVAVAKAGYPQYFNNPANPNQPTHPRFTFKIMDGDGLDDNGKPNNEKPGFAGCYVMKFSSQFPPKCFRTGHYHPSEEIQNPQQDIKRGWFVRVGGNAAPNIGSDVPGLYVNHTLVELCYGGPEITSGPDAAAVFGGTALGAMPAGATALIPGQASTPAAPPAPGAPAVPGAVAPPPTGAPIAPPPTGAPVAPPVAAPVAPVAPVDPMAAARADGWTAHPTSPGYSYKGAECLTDADVAARYAAPAAPPAAPPVAPAAPAIPTPPAAPAAPPAAPPAPNPAFVQQAGQQFTMTAAAGGVSREDHHKAGWTDDMLIQHGKMTKNY